MSKSGLIVRRSIRHEIVLPAKVRVAPEHAQTVRFAKGVTDLDGWFDCDLIDFASGGAGVVGHVFLPRGSAIELMLPDAEPSNPPMLRTRCRVMRIQMTDRRPAYLIGLAFTDIEDHTKHAIDTILDRLEGTADEPEQQC